ncbi:MULTISPECIES: GNAT family N-acetyltransferase [Nonlabens]|uniref:Acetyltransferase (GNAT) family protein n=1 Tax=Nonlabens xylanidelens TaxID=191564 RepID=A0A2S6IIP3_9FLAO|nr:GNAT family N-acetyltransferase [Nonlabens xylanidelens]PPK94087.1 acetyltransferase (GNAT) family protein [Nonlabens xylanidelens]PQJ22238.1 GTP cyclohydrolase [Nonlabens xylanidelens]
MIEVRKIESKKDIKKFVQFPLDLYKDNAYFVPPIIKDEIDIFDRDKNQVFKNAECWMFLAYKDHKIVGRVAALINHIEINEQKKSKMRFGWLDMIDDIEVTRALLNKVDELGREQKLEFTEGPVGFSNMDKAGMLIKGFDEVSTMITWYNHSYYMEHLEQLGYEKAAEWVEFKFKPPNPIPDKINRFADIIARKYDLKSLRFKTTKEILPYVDAMFDLLNKTYSNLVTFVPIQQYQIELYKDKYLPFINPDFIELVTDQDDKLVGFAITMPSFSKALQKANGKLFPFGFLHLLKAKKKNTEAAFYLIGIDPEYQGKGVTAMMFRNITQNFMNYGISKCETNPELEDNMAVQASWKNYNPILHKRRRTYRKNL